MTMLLLNIVIIIINITNTKKHRYHPTKATKYRWPTGYPPTDVLLQSTHHHLRTHPCNHTYPNQNISIIITLRLSYFPEYQTAHSQTAHSHTAHSNRAYTLG